MRSAGPRFRFAAAVFLVTLLATPFINGQDPSSDPGHLSVQAVYPVLIQAMQEGNLTRARVICEKTIAWEPRNAVHRYNLARIESREGGVHLKRALSSLKEAIALGFSDTAQLRSDPDLAAVRAEPEFAEILRAAGRNPGAPSTTVEVATTPATARVSVPAKDVVLEPAPAADVTKPLSLPPLAPTSGHIIGRVVAENGRPIPEVTMT